MTAIVGHVPVHSTANSTPLGLLEKCSPEDLSCKRSGLRAPAIKDALDRAARRVEAMADLLIITQPILLLAVVLGALSLRYYAVKQGDSTLRT